MSAVNIVGLPDVYQTMASVSAVYQKVASRSINASVRKGRTLATQKVYDELNLKKTYIRDKFAMRFANPDNLSGALSADVQGLLLSRFIKSRLSVKAKSPVHLLKGYPAMSDTRITIKALAPGRKQSGFSIRVKRNGSIKRVKYFPYRLKRGSDLGQGAIALAYEDPYREGTLNLAYGPSVSQAFETFRPALQDELQAYYRTEFQRLLDRELS